MSIEIKELNSLNDEITSEIRKLELICKEYDGLKGSMYLDTSMNFDKNMKSIFLLYKDEKLVSLLSVFVPTSLEGEVYAYTLPEYRKRGYFKKLLFRAGAELKSCGVADILFTCESRSSTGNIVIRKLNAKYDHSEYFMVYENSKYPFVRSDKGDGHKLKLYVPRLDDLERLVSMDESIFGEGHEDSRTLNLNTLKSEKRKKYATIFGNELIGVCSSSFEDGETSIYGFGILPEYQGKGFGREFLNLILKDLLSHQGQKKIVLEVNSSNQKAFNLYKKSGFVVETSYDYYIQRMEPFEQ